MQTENKIGKFMVAVGAVIEHSHTEKILLLKRTTKNNYFSGGIWEYITGRIDQFEEPEKALKREIKEEAGININIIKLLDTFHIFRGEKIAENELIGIMYWCKTENDIITLSEEHTDYKWVTAEESLKLIINTNMQNLIKKFIKERINYIQSGVHST